MDKKKLYIGIGIVAVVIILLAMGGSDEGENNDLLAKAEKGLFEIKVFTTGEMEAKNSVDIKGPPGLRSVGIWRVQIADLVPEGTKVKKGDYIASLDKSEISGKISDAGSELSKAESQYTQTRIDTTLDLRQAREEIINLEYAFKEKTITLEQSKYEPPATIRQAEIELEKSQRALNEKRENYTIKVKQSEAKMQEVAATLAKRKNRYEQLRTVLEGFNINAPEDGMVIYEREWNGKKKTTGSEIGAWDPTVATLPDLSTMISKTYVNEVDIRKVKVDQVVMITLDAFPDKKLTGKIIEVANVGEQLPNTDSKVFEVRVQINEADTTLRPGMTTGNNIIANSMDDVIYVPLESIHSQEDTLVYVYKKSGWGYVKQEVVIGERNEDHAIVLNGLEEDDEVLLSIPSDSENIDLERLETAPEVN